jgi:hypothetical protein
MRGQSMTIGYLFFLKSIFNSEVTRVVIKIKMVCK